MFILQICEFRDDGDGYYRLHEPSRQLSRLPDVTVVDCHFYHRALPELVQAADVLILPFVHNWDCFPLIESRRAAGKITVFEANDYFYDVQPWNAVGSQWQDRAIQDEYRYYMAAADAVQTSADQLARHWSAWSRRVAVFPNQLADVPPLAPPPSRSLVVGWGGSPGHFADWYHLAPNLERWLLAHPQVHLAVMTNEFARTFVNLPAERYHFTPFGSLADYLRFLPALDIGLAPLLPTEYNRCRSDVKFLEYAAHGVAGIYADLEPYRASVVHGETGLLHKTVEELFEHLDRLVTEPALRLRLRERAHAHVSKHRGIAGHIGARRDFYRALLPNRTGETDVAAEVLGEAVRDGRYYQFRPGVPERTLLEIKQSPPSDEALHRLERLVQLYPDYLAALQQLGRVGNDRRDPRRALPYLERALALYPRSAAVLSEIGRAWFLLNDAEAARHHLEKALTINPYYFSGWQYLLRLLHMHPHAEGRGWAERGQALFPRNYVLALAGVKLSPPAEAVPRLRGLLDLHAPTVTLDEMPAAAAAFSQALAEIVGRQLGRPDVLELLGRACEVFPQSARLADLLGRALHLAGRLAESRRNYVRALDIHRQTVAFRAEFPKDDGSVHYWQFAEHIRGCLKKGQEPSTRHKE